MYKKQALLRIFVWICIILAVCYPLLSVIPYYHTCTDDGCMICYFNQITKDICIALTVLAYVGIANPVFDSITYAVKTIFYKNANLVLQKVKLSD